MLVPLCWWLMPRQSAWSFGAALSIAFLQGLADIGWGIGATRLLYVKVVPPERKTEYMALYAAAMGVIGGLGQLGGGWIVDSAAGISGRFLIFPLDAYTMLFVIGLILPLLSGSLFRGVRADSTVTLGEFAKMFFRGNPFLAMETLVGYRRAKDEHATVSITERLGRTDSPLTVDELLQTLDDPRFYVRFETIVSIARRRPDPRLMEALIDVLNGNAPALSVIAAWALGRIGDKRAIEPLRARLDAPHRSVRAFCARSLGALGDRDGIPTLLERLASEPDKGLQLAYASALGILGAEDAVDHLLTMLRTSEDKSSRMELALALARIVGNEQYFIRLWRQMRSGIHTVASQAITSAEKKVKNTDVEHGDLVAAIGEFTDTLAREDLQGGMALMSHIIRLLPTEDLRESSAIILQECAKRLDEYGAERIEYLLLALHHMHQGWR